MIDLSYRPRLADLRTLSPQSLGLLPFEREGVRTSDAGAFQGRAGYDADFLPGFAVPLPDTGAIAGDVLPVTGSEGDRLDYKHFSILMSKSRRLPSSPPSISMEAPACRYRVAEIRGRSTAAFPKRPRRGMSYMPITISIAAILCGAKIQTGARRPA